MLVRSFGGNLVFKKLNAKMKRSINPMVLLDYRCHAPGGRIGTDYPPELDKVGTAAQGTQSIASVNQVMSASGCFLH